MGARVLANALRLAGEAERRIRAAGRVPPPPECLLAAVMPHAKVVTRAAKHLEEAERQLAAAQVLARQAAESAVTLAEVAADAYIASVPAPRTVPFDPARFIVTLTPVPQELRSATTRAGDLG